ncbi:eppin [Elysia marginata]|uniref:Eppin n=1 Tax=Elysia marginata TaxID=1093978 RepID=A0AAV4IM01_9GAST|nr:eppin [Elysia marginata]
MTDLQVIDRLADFANDLTGIDNISFRQMISSYQFDGPARLDFKYGCTRGVHSTPMFTVNDVFLGPEAGAWGVRDWKVYINSKL